MKKQKLTFKVDGGLEKISSLYATAENNKQAVETYWQNPAALLEAISVKPEREIRISSGYKKIADTMDTIDFGKWHNTFELEGNKSSLSLQKNAFTSLWHAVNGYDPSLQAGKLNDDFDKVSENSIAAAVIIIVVVTVTCTSGYEHEEPIQRAPVPGGMKIAGKRELAHMSRYAQTVAEQIGWFS